MNEPLCLRVSVAILKNEPLCLRVSVATLVSVGRRLVAIVIVGGGAEVILLA